LRQRHFAAAATPLRHAMPPFDAIEPPPPPDARHFRLLPPLLRHAAGATNMPDASLMLPLPPPPPRAMHNACHDSYAAAAIAFYERRSYARR